ISSSPLSLSVSLGLVIEFSSLSFLTSFYGADATKFREKVANQGVFHLSPRSTKTAERSFENNLGPSPSSFRRCQHEHDPTTENGSSGNAKGSAVGQRCNEPG